MLTLLASLLAVASAAPSSHGAFPRQSGYGQSTPMAYLKNGTVSGLHSTTYNQDFFLGVPYAEPPVGPNRFRVPQSLNSTYNSTYEATEYAPSCVGYGGDDLGYPVSEDCLYLNVVRPSGYEGEDLPIGFWIHGGGFSMGGSRDLRYNLSFIVDNSVKIGKPFIGVSINYRLAGWGFLSSQEVSGAGHTNLGLRDQRLALHWLQENAAAFGGDKDRVTIWGESAGAASVGFQLTAYNGRDDGLFRAGIMESGNPVYYNSFHTPDDTQDAYDMLVNMTSCGSAIDTLDCLRRAPYDTVNNFFNSTAGGDFDPIVDGDFVARWASIQLAEGDFVKVPIIDGANSDEGVSFGRSGINTTQQFIAAATAETGSVVLPAAFGQELLEAYPDSPEYMIPGGNFTYPPSAGALIKRTNAYYGDAVMIANRRGACQTWAANNISAFCYRFDTIPTGLTSVQHFQEVAFVFDNTQGLGYDALHGTVNPYGGKPQSYYDLGFLISASWASFIHDLDPNFTVNRNSTPSWPVYDNAKPQDFVFAANHTGLAYAEDDTWRQEGIQFILDHNVAYHR